MNRTGFTDLPLHGGKAPSWLFKRMVSLSKSIIDILVQEYSIKEIFAKFSDPFWFQSLACILGYDWHSSGTTTVTCGALKEAIIPEKHGFAFTGGKGTTSRKTPFEIERISSIFNLSTDMINKMQYASKMTAKVDNVAIQDHHSLYHHCFFFTEQGLWGVIQQGMNDVSQYARRYHWCSETIDSFINEPHTYIFGERLESKILNMTAKESVSNQKTCVDLINDHPRHIMHDWASLKRHENQRTLDDCFSFSKKRICEETLSMPRCLNWKKMHELYDVQPKNYQEFISLKGVGPSTVRALALISDLIYGDKPSWQDPVKYSYAHGGKDGVPFPVDTSVMDESVTLLKQGILDASIGKNEKLIAIKRLRNCFIFGI